MRSPPGYPPLAVIGLAAALWLATACQHGDAAALSKAERAQLHLSRNQPAQALPLLEELHADNPSDLSIARALCEAQVKAGKADAFIARVRAAAAAPGGDTAANHYLLGLAYFARSADASGPAVGEFERAIALAPGDAELHYRLGVALLESERFEQALAPLQRALELAPGRSAIALPLAKAYYRNGDSPKAIAALRLALSGEPTLAEVGTARALMDQISDPFARLPKAVRPRLEQGIEWLDRQDVPQQAIVAFEEILREYPDLAVVHALLGLAYQRVDDAGRAVDEFKRAIELSPDDGKNHLYLGELYLGRQRTRQGEAELEAALAKNPLLDQAHARLGDLALERGEVPKAKEHYRLLVKLQPRAGPARAKLALALQASGDYAAADRQLKALLDQEPENLDVKLRLGLLHAERHQKARGSDEKKASAAEASRWLRVVLKEQPENAAASRALDGLRAD